MATGGQNEVIPQAVCDPGDWREQELGWELEPPGEKWKPREGTEGISGNRVKLVTAVKLRPQTLKQTFWLKKKEKGTDFILLLT